MATYFKAVADSFWSEYVWLPPNTTWKDIEPKADSNIRHTDHRHLLYPLPMAILMLILRYLLEKYWISPIGLSLGISNSRPKKAPENPVLENAYLQSKNWKYKQIQGLAKQLDMTERQIERWLRLRKRQNRPPTLVKFCENSFRCLYYICNFIFGLIILWDKPWLWNINECWTNFPHQGITNDIWWYYMISMSFYWSLTISQFFDVKHNDFWQMFVHHIATIVLMCLSWIVNVHRIGSLVILLHDCSDIFLEAVKATKYSGYQKICDAVFIVFTFVWMLTRLGIYPFWIIKNTSIEAPTLVPMFPAYYIFNSLLLLLLVLHCFWAYLILKIAYSSLRAGFMIGDIRSSSEEDTKTR